MKKTAKNNLKVTFTGAYDGEILKSATNKINFKLSKNAFKNNVVEEDAACSMILYADNLLETYTHDSSEDPQKSIIIKIDTNSIIKSTGVSINEDAFKGKEYPGTIYPLSTYSKEATADETISFYYNYDELGSDLWINLKKLTMSCYNFYTINTPQLKIFNNLPANYGFKTQIGQNSGSQYVIPGEPLFAISYIYYMSE